MASLPPAGETSNRVFDGRRHSVVHSDGIEVFAAAQRVASSAEGHELGSE
jgi:hypothetical protein